MNQFVIPGTGNFHFSGTRIDKLGATEYTLATLVLDVSGSVDPFKNDLLKFVKAVADACKKSPRAQNLMLRFLTFNQTVVEMHGFKELASIDVNAYSIPRPDGYTALFDAAFDAIGATLTYSDHLIKQDFLANGCIYILTDGMNNASKTTERMIKQLIEDSKKGEKIESLLTLLIGMHDPNLSYQSEVMQSLKSFQANAGIDQFVDVGAATPQRIAKLTGFVSQSVSSTSQVIGTGAPSQPPSVTF
jgi:uncharacterized protein YegL